MRKTIINIPLELSDGIQACQIELDGLKQLIGFLLSSVEYNIPEEKINKLQQDFMKKNKEYNDLKLQVENYIPADFDKNKTSWNLDFSTYEVEIVED